MASLRCAMRRSCGCSGSRAKRTRLGRNLQPDEIHHSRPADNSHYYPERGMPGLPDGARRHARLHVPYELFFRLDGTSFPAEYWSNPDYSRRRATGCRMQFHRYHRAHARAQEQQKLLLLRELNHRDQATCSPSPVAA